MIWIARIGVGLVALFSLAMGLQALIVPEQLGETLGVGAVTPLGLNSLRADFAAFFLTPAIACLGALFMGRAGWLYAAALIYGQAAAFRILGVGVTGAPEGVVPPIIVELVLTALALFGARVLARRPG